MAGFRFGAKLRWSPTSGWSVVLTVLGTAIAQIPLPAVVTVVGYLAAGAAVVASGAIILVGGVVISSELYCWATSDGGSSSDSSAITRDRINRERRNEGFEPDATHVAICGPAGAGKTSLLNALRGLRNSDHEAARTGTVETTTQRFKYSSHPSFGSLFLHDCPGAGTLRNPAMNYYYSKKRNRLQSEHSMFL
jgi:hypothetical protein